MTLGAFLYFLLLALWSATIAYLLLFKAIPFFTTEQKSHHPPTPHHPASSPPSKITNRSRYSMHQGFRSYARGEHLTIEDIVKGLSRQEK